MREYRQGDYLALDLNGFTHDYDGAKFEDMPNLEKYTLEDSGKPVVCMYFFEYHPDCYEGFFAIDKNISINNIKHLKRFLDSIIIERKANRVQTSSEDCPVINRWMEFLGFECEGIKRKFAFNKDYRMWSRLNGN